jgi:catechol 2,3-dioxygenase-like lactoylglutathione lyase family enzyme
MKVKRIVANIATEDIAKAKRFYGDILGLDVLMDHGWLVTYGSDVKMTVQVGVAIQGGSDTPVPDLSIEVDDVEEALARMKKAKIKIEYGPANEPWSVRRFYVRDPFGKLVNILMHIS